MALLFNCLMSLHAASSLSADPSSLGVSPEVLKALAELVKASGSTPKSDEWWSSERIQALASAIGAVAWPLTLLVLVYVYHKQIIIFISNATEIEIVGAKFKRLQRELEKVDEEASKRNAPSTQPTEAEQAQAENIGIIFDREPALIKKEAQILAQEYDHLRASMPKGVQRTRKMEIIVARMRALGRAIYPYRYELAASLAPGMRLQAIASLQISPDYDMLDWLAMRLQKEQPFIAYHALVAIIQAAKNPFASTHLYSLNQTLEIAKSSLSRFDGDSEIHNLVTELENSIMQITK